MCMCMRKQLASFVHAAPCFQSCRGPSSTNKCHINDRTLQVACASIRPLLHAWTWILACAYSRRAITPMQVSSTCHRPVSMASAARCTGCCGDCQLDNTPALPFCWPGSCRQPECFLCLRAVLLFQVIPFCSIFASPSICPNLAMTG